jgi:TonB family protein
MRLSAAVLCLTLSAACSGSRGNPGIAPAITSRGDTILPRMTRLGRHELPKDMVQCGYNGRVVVSYTVDTSGVVERGSIVIVRSSHRMFEQPARLMLLGSEFQPALYQGHKVRMMRTDTLGWRINGGSEDGYSQRPRPGCSEDRH